MQLSLSEAILWRWDSKVLYVIGVPLQVPNTVVAATVGLLKGGPQFCVCNQSYEKRNLQFSLNMIDHWG